MSLSAGHVDGVLTNHLKESDMNSSVTFRCAAVAIAALVSGSVLAADPSKTVSYADLNLKSSAGVAALYKRIT